MLCNDKVKMIQFYKEKIKTDCGVHCRNTKIKSENLTCEIRIRVIAKSSHTKNLPRCYGTVNNKHIK